ncbi:hypothetical protein FS837_008296, partial [Tulasnella sp. UAMH 9824]
MNVAVEEVLRAPAPLSCAGVYNPTFTRTTTPSAFLPPPVSLTTSLTTLMVHFSLLSATAGLLAATASLVSATPVPSNQNEEPRARIVPFVNKHAVARSSEGYNHGDVVERDLRRIKRRNELADLRKRSGTENVKVKRTAAALEPYDINTLRKARMTKRQGSAADPLVNKGDA